MYKLMSLKVEITCATQPLGISPLYKVSSNCLCCLAPRLLPTTARAVAPKGTCCPRAVSCLMLQLWTSLRHAITLTHLRSSCVAFQKVAWSPSGLLILYISKRTQFYSLQTKIKAVFLHTFYSFRIKKSTCRCNKIAFNHSTSL